MLPGMAIPEWTKVQRQNQKPAPPPDDATPSTPTVRVRRVVVERLGSDKYRVLVGHVVGAFVADKVLEGDKAPVSLAVARASALKLAHQYSEDGIP
jgi:alpha-beta hydrolase superfamily lysophospholipase